MPTLRKRKPRPLDRHYAVTLVTWKMLCLHGQSVAHAGRKCRRSKHCVDYADGSKHCVACADGQQAGAQLETVLLDSGMHSSRRERPMCSGRTSSASSVGLPIFLGPVGRRTRLLYVLMHHGDDHVGLGSIRRLGVDRHAAAAKGAAGPVQCAALQSPD